MTAQTSEKPLPRRPETGWSRARRLRAGRALRTCLPATADESAGRAARRDQEDNIFRGED